MTTATAIAAAVDKFGDILERHPERRSDHAEQAIVRGELRRYPVLYLGHAPDTDAPPAAAPTYEPDPQIRLLERIRGLVGPLEMLNPIAPRVGLGKGTGTLPASFGIELDASLGNTPKGERNIDDVLAEGMPDPETSGIIPEMRADIDAALALAPDWIEIAPPDMQGPFNIAHMVLGTEAFVLPATEPEKFQRLMTMITDFFLAVDDNLHRWIGESRFPKFPTATGRIAECSVNMMSEKMYVEHVLPHDLRLAKHRGHTAIHPCSGPHVFRATLQNLPNVVYSEAGYIAKAYAGSISVDDAFVEVGNRPFILGIGEEVPEGSEEEFMRRDLDRARVNPRLLYGFTGMHWQSRDRDAIRAMHVRLDDYWEQNVWRG
ncbi:MAG TPA: hypothetical protein VGK19_08015 [Capsulimonadaceae bacterium]|jgi:hypothetical protein